MDTQTMAASELTPTGIVEQLLELAENNNCINEIGSATAWRWREGIITRMPKKQTVAKVLKKAFGSDCPQDWFSKTKGELKHYIKNSFSLDVTTIDKFDPSDVYEALFILNIGDGRGVTFEELVFKLAYLKFCKGEDADPAYFPDLADEEMILQMNGPWAEKKAVSIIEKFGITVSENGGYCLPPERRHYSSESMNQFSSDLIRYRLKATGGRSHFDMWRFWSVSLSDSEMIEIEKKFCNFYEELGKSIADIQDRKIRDEDSMRLRLLRMDCVTMPNKAGESIKWEK